MRSTRPNWDRLITDKALSRCGKAATTVAELAAEMRRLYKVDVTGNAVTKAHGARAQARGLPSLAEFLGGKRRRKLRVEDVKWPLSHERRKELAGAKRFVITSATNGVAVHPAAWGALRRYARQHKAALVVVPIRYRNPTSPTEARKLLDDAQWPAEVTPFLIDDQIDLHEHLTVLGQVRVQPTAVHPLSGLDGTARGQSAIFGHPQLSMRMVPTPHRGHPTALWTTGSVSQRHYSDSRAGFSGDHHHSLGGLVVELDGPRFHVRNLSVDSDGGIADLDRYYTAGATRKTGGCEALIIGDEHVRFIDPKCKSATFDGAKSIVGVLRPKVLVRHDVFDAHSISHHTRKDPISRFVRHATGRMDVRDELQECADHLARTTPKGCESWVVASNHHDHLTRWLRETAMDAEPWNARTWHELWGGIMASAKFGEAGVEFEDPFAAWMRRNLPKGHRVRFLGHREPATIAGVLVGEHGHRGANGAKGTLRGFGRIGVRSVTGHTHTPGIEHGAWMVGATARLVAEYTGGLSSWAHADVAIHKNGKRQMILIIDGHWRGA